MQADFIDALELPVGEGDVRRALDIDPDRGTRVEDLEPMLLGHEELPETGDFERHVAPAGRVNAAPPAHRAAQHLQARHPSPLPATVRTSMDRARAQDRGRGRSAA